MSHATYRWVSATLILSTGLWFISLFMYTSLWFRVLAGVILWCALSVPFALVVARVIADPRPDGPVVRHREPHRDWYITPRGDMVEGPLS